MLVVADQPPLRVGGERRLPRAGEPEEDRDLAVVADVRGAVHRDDAVERQPVVHEREDRLLDLAGVLGAADQHLAAGRVEEDEGRAAGAVGLGIGLDRGRVQDERLRLELLELLARRVDEERLREERVPRAVGDDANAEPVRRVGSGERVHDVQVARLQVRDELVAKALEAGVLDRLVHAAPPDPALGARLADDELVPRRAAGVLAGVDDERPALGEARLSARDRCRVEDRGRGPPDDAGLGPDAVHLEAAVVVEPLAIVDAGRGRHRKKERPDAPVWRSYGNRMRLLPPDPPLGDGTVVLRPWQEVDAPAIVAAIDGDPEIAAWLDAIPQPYRLADARAYLAACRRSWADGSGAPFAILDTRSGSVAGSIGARFFDPVRSVAEVGYWVAREARGRSVGHGGCGCSRAGSSTSSASRASSSRPT